MNKAIVFDIDGTLADSRHRDALAEHALWREYVEGTIADAPIASTCEMLRAYHTKGYTIIIFTSRRDSQRMRELTEQWLHAHNLPFSSLYMRAPHDSAYAHKLFTLQELKQKFDIQLVLDDEYMAFDICNYLKLPCKLLSSFSHHENKTQ